MKTVHSLMLAASMLTLVSKADTLEITRKEDGTPVFKRIAKPQQKAQETQPCQIKQQQTSYTATAKHALHYAVKHGGLFVASVIIPTIVPKGYINPETGALFGAAAGGVYAAVNGTKVADSVVAGATLGCFTSAGITSNNDAFKGITLRATHGAILDMTSSDKMVKGALCGATQGTADVIIAKVLCPSSFSEKDFALSTIAPATIVLLAGLGKPQVKNAELPPLNDLLIADILGSESYCGSTNITDLPGQHPSKVIVKLIAQSAAAARIQEKFDELDTRNSQGNK